MTRLVAEESLRAATRIAVGFGSPKGKQIAAQWAQAAELEPAVQRLKGTQASTMPAIGIGVRTVTKR